VVHDVVTGIGIDVSVYDPDFDSLHGRSFFLPNIQTGPGAHPDYVVLRLNG
jgi:hypothetical protein